MPKTRKSDRFAVQSSSPVVADAGNTVARLIGDESTLPELTGKATEAQASRQFDLGYLALLIPACLILAVQPNAVFSPPGIDSWVYLGFFRNLVNFKRDLFLSTYYGSRLSWIIPGYLVHQILSPVAAAFVLHLLVYFTGLFSLYYILRATLGRRIGLLGTLSFAFYPFLWSAVGWDYVDGVGITYFLLTAAFLTRAALGTRPAVSLTGAGASYAAMFYTNMAWLFFTPVLGMHYLWLRKDAGFRTLLLSCSRLGAWSGLGVGAVTVVLGSINYLIEGDFWFYSPSISFAFRQIGLSNPWYQRLGFNGHLAEWLWLPALVLLVGAFSYAVLAIQGRIAKRDAELLYFVEFVMCFGFWGYLQYRGSAMLGVYYYASYLIPTGFLALAPIAWSAAQRLTFNGFCAIVSAAVGIMILPWWLPASKTMLGLEKLGVPWAGILAGVLLLAVMNLRMWAWSLCLSIVSFELLYAAVFPQARIHYDAQSRYERVMSARASVEAVRDQGRIRWWYDGNDPNAEDFNSLASTYLWGYTLVSLNFPEIPPKTAFAPPTLLAVTSSNPDIGDIAIRNLRGFLKPKGLAAIVKRIEKIPAPRTPYYLALFAIQEDPGGKKPLFVSYDSGSRRAVMELAPERSTRAFPSSAWSMASYTGAEGWLAQRSESVEVMTPRLPQAYATMYPLLRAPADGTYRFALKVKPLSGHLTFGMLSGDQSHWIVSTNTSEKAGFSQTMQFDIALRAGEEFRLLTANLQSSNRASHYLIEEVRAYLVSNE